MRKPKRKSKNNSFFSGLGEGAAEDFFLLGPSWVPLAPYGSCSSLSGHPRAFLWARLGRFGPSAESCFYTRIYSIFSNVGALMAFSASFGLSWTRPVGPGGRSEGPASLAHGIAFSRFFVNDAFFPRLRFSSLQGGVKGGSWSYFRTFLGPT